MKIMILANDSGGLYKFRKEVVRELVKKGEVYICVPDGGFIDEIKKLGCEVIYCDLLERRRIKPIKEINLFLFYKELIKKIKPSIVFTYTIKPNIYGGAICASLGIPYVANITGLGTAVENGGLMQKITLTLYRMGLRKAQRIFFQNMNNYQFMSDKGVVGGNCLILPGSGVNLQEHCYETYPSEKEGIRFLFVGRIMKEKGIEEFLHCAKRIRETHPECLFDIVGGYEEEYYRPIITQYEAEGIVKAFGIQKDVHSFIKSHHVLIQPSYHEGMSNVLLEAAACGRPVIASNIPGCRETFDEGISGIGFNPGDSESLVASVERLISINSDEREYMGICGRRKVEQQFSRQIVIDSYLKELCFVSQKINT